MSMTAENMSETQMDEWLNKKLDELLPSKLEQIDAARTPSMAIIATKGTLDWAYPPSSWLLPLRLWGGIPAFSSPFTHCCS